MAQSQFHVEMEAVICVICSELWLCGLSLPWLMFAVHQCPYSSSDQGLWEVFVYQKLLGGRHGFHSYKTRNNTQSQISFYKNDFKGPAYSKMCQEMCVWVRKSNLCCFVWRHGGERGDSRLNIKDLQEDVACVTSSSLSQWDSSCGTVQTTGFMLWKGTGSRLWMFATELG